MRRRSNSISGRVAIVTGAARGIGRATASALLEQGCTVVVADRDQVAAQGAVRELASLGAVHNMPLDVTDGAAFEALVQRVEDELGPVDVLVNNAGVMVVGDFDALDARADHLQLDINVMGVIHGMRAVLPRMRRRGRGHVVNIASVAGRVGLPFASVYSATKFAVVGLTEAIRREYQDTGVDFSYVCPSMVDTELISGAGRPRFPPVARPEDVAGAVIRALKTRQVDLYVPRFTRISHILPAILPRVAVEALGRFFGVERIFSQTDPGARSDYLDRTVRAVKAPPEDRPNRA